MMFKNILFNLVLVIALLEVLALIFTLLFPKYRVWPPPKKKSWQFWYTWVGFGEDEVIQEPCDDCDMTGQKQIDGPYDQCYDGYYGSSSV